MADKNDNAQEQFLNLDNIDRILRTMYKITKDLHNASDYGRAIASRKSYCFAGICRSSREHALT